MKKILVLGAGRSATTLIHYLNGNAQKEGWSVSVGDADESSLKLKLENLRHIQGHVFNVENPEDRTSLINSHDFVISLLPWTLHVLVAQDCLDLSKHLITASYVTEEIRELAKQARAKGLFFMGELGLDPGIDHMSALQLIHRIRAEGDHITSFHSYAGGLVAEESDTNPWHYKITWNPRNVILAGQGTAQYKADGQYIIRPYNKLFAQAYPISIGTKESYEVYPNRDSLKYIDLYGLHGIPSIMRGTVRIRGFSRAWNALIQLGLTDSMTPLHVEQGFTWKKLIQGIISGDGRMSLEEQCAKYLGLNPGDPVMEQLIWLGIFNDESIGQSGLSAADYLQKLIEDRWKLEPGDRDLVVMEHRIRYVKDGQEWECRSSLEYEGKDSNQTAMADLVGLPLGICAKLFLQGALTLQDEPLPFDPSVYNPIMKDLKETGVHFKEINYLKNNVDEWEVM